MKTSSSGDRCRMEQPYGNVEFWTGTAHGAGGTKRRRLRRFDRRLYANAADNGFSVITQGAARITFRRNDKFRKHDGMLHYRTAIGWDQESNRRWNADVLSAAAAMGQFERQSEKFRSAGPHCGKCGYDFWTVAVENGTGYIAAHLRLVRRKITKGPKTIFHLLSDKEKGEII